MTTIAWDGKRLAADKQLTQGGLKRTVTKIARAGASLVGAAGNSDVCGEMIAWVQAGAEEASFPQLQRGPDFANVVMIGGDGSIWVFAQSPIPIRIEDPIFATGSGRDFAMAAMFLGVSAEKAVAVACQFDCDSGMGIDVLELEELTEEQP